MTNARVRVFLRGIIETERMPLLARLAGARIT